MDSGSNFTALLAGLEQGEKPALRAAIDALVLLAQSSAPARAVLHQKMSERQRQNPWAIAYVLAQLPEPSRDVVQRLLDSLDHPDADVRWAIGLLLVRLARNNDEITKSLRRLCAAGNALQRRMAVYCLRDYSLQDPATTEIFLRALRDADPLVRMAAAASFKKKNDLDPVGKEALLRVFLEDAESRVRSVAAVALAQIGAPSEEFLRALGLAEDSDDEQIRRAATVALAYLENKRAAPSGN